MFYTDLEPKEKTYTASAAYPAQVLKVDLNKFNDVLNYVGDKLATCIKS